MMIPYFLITTALQECEVRDHDASSFIFHLKIPFTMWCLLWFLTNVRIVSYISVKNAVGIFIGSNTESVDCFVLYRYFNSINSSNP